MSSTSTSKLQVHGSHVARSMLHSTAGFCTNQSMFWADELYTKDPYHIAFQQGLRVAVKAMGYNEDDDMSTMFESISKADTLLHLENYRPDTLKFKTPPTCLASETPLILTLPETWKQKVSSYSKAREMYAIMTASDIKVFDLTQIDQAMKPVKSSVLKVLVLPDGYTEQSPSLHFAFMSTDHHEEGDKQMAFVTDKSDLTASVVASAEMLIYPESLLKRRAESVLGETTLGGNADGGGSMTNDQLAETFKNEKTRIFSVIRQKMQVKANEEATKLRERHRGVEVLEITDETPISLIMASPTEHDDKEKHTEWVMTTFSDGFHQDCDGGFYTLVGAAGSDVETSSVVQ